MKSLKLTTKGEVLLFRSNFDPPSVYYACPSRIIKELEYLYGWSIYGRYSHSFAKSILGVAGNLCVFHWCEDDSDARTYAIYAHVAFEAMEKTPQYKRLRSSIILPSWIYDKGKAEAVTLEKLGRLRW